MSAQLINWEKLIPYDTDQSRSFEELCYQVAKKQFEKDGVFTSIDDSGGGDGVEFYLTFPNGDQWGWQSKLDLPGDRLDEGGRKEAIKKSLRKACKEHPKLKKFILCTPKNLTPAEQSWYANKLANSILDGSPVVPATSKVALDRWGESDFIGWMSEERFAGIRHFFFGELELSMEWFRRQFEKQTAGIKEKFSHSLHTPTHADAVIHRLLADDVFAGEVKGMLEELKKRFAEYQKALRALRGNEPRRIQWGDTKKDFIEAAAKTEKDLERILAEFQQAADHLTLRRFDLLRKTDWQALRALMQEAGIRIADPFNAIELDALTCEGKPEEQGEIRYRATQILEQPSVELNQCWEHTEKLLDGFVTAQVNELHMIGDAGSGKTQLAAEICFERLNTSFPAIFVSGKHFAGSGPIEDQLRAILDIPPAYSWNDFLMALDAAANAYRTRIPIFIDGLNESVRNGCLSDVWKLGLPGFCKELGSTNNVALLTSCRGSYRDSIWTGEELPRFLSVEGFDYDSVEEAVQKYFAAYKIEAELTSESLEHFRHPLYLKLFCETKNPERKEIKCTFVGKAGLFEVFDEFLKQCNTAIRKRLGLHPAVDVLTPALAKLAECLWNENARSVDVSRAVTLIDDKAIEEVNWEQSRTKAVESEGLLVSRDWLDAGERLAFTYDLLAGYVIAKHLLNVNASRLSQFANDPGLVERLFSQDHQKRHPLHADIARCMAALLRIQGGLHWHRLSTNKHAFSCSINSLFELGPEHVDPQCADEVLKLFQKPENRSPLFRAIRNTITIDAHPLGITLLHSALQGLSMAERDLSWTEFVRAQAHALEGFVERIQRLCAGAGEISDGEAKRLHLSARYIMWMLTSTMRPFRDKVTRALYYYGRKHPNELFELVQASLAVNDIYVPERMLAAAYGVCMARQNDFADPRFASEVLPVWTRWIYDNIFAPGAKYSTTHVLMRDYARRICEIGLLKQSGLLKAEEVGRMRPPYKEGGLREWEEEPIEDDHAWVKAGSPFRMDFENYTLGRLVDGRGNYDFKHQGYRKERACVLRRVFQLGWNAKDFDEIDQRIARTQGVARVGVGGAQTDRYGKKYSWIAFFERVGVLRDEGFDKESFDADRPSDADLDPSFPHPLPETQIVKSDYLDDGKSTNAEWIANGPTPKLEPYFVLSGLNGELGQWVLVDAFLTQECKRRDRRIFAFLRTFIVRQDELVDFNDCLSKQDLGNRWLPEKPTTHYAFAGEFPWSDTWHAFGWCDISFDVRWPRREFKALIPVHEYGWESYHSVLNQDAHATLLAKELALDLSLVGQPQTHDLYDQTGRRATIAVTHRIDHNNEQHLLYLRKDLLDSYLAKNGYGLACAVWGEREYSADTNKRVAENRQERPEPLYQVFSAVIDYPGCAKSQSAIGKQS